ncbi:multidrug resistance-associated 4-like isoform X1, partial [Paramuricea clavata]
YRNQATRTFISRMSQKRLFIGHRISALPVLNIVCGINPLYKYSSCTARTETHGGVLANKICMFLRRYVLISQASTAGSLVMIDITQFQFRDYFLKYHNTTQTTHNVTNLEPNTANGVMLLTQQYCSCLYNADFGLREKECAFCFLNLKIQANKDLAERVFRKTRKFSVPEFDNPESGCVCIKLASQLQICDDARIFLACNVLYWVSQKKLLWLTVFGLAILLISVLSQPYIAVVVVPIIGVFVWLRQYFVKSSREIKRIEALSRSPLYSHISATLQGLATIRASEEQNQFHEKYNKYQDRNTSASYYYLAANRWLGYRLDIICAILMTFVAFAPFIAHEAGLGGVNPVLVGLSLLYTKRLTGMFQFCVRQTAEVENQMVSVERVQQYTQLESEAALEELTGKPADAWPQHGEIIGETVVFRYHSSLPPVLKGIKFHIKPKEKIGIVGRTGAGKSSLISALFRLAEPSGKINIDGVSIKEIGLHDLREKLSIIPQDPVIFAGSVRDNLDPFSNHTDTEIWSALEQVQLKDVVNNFPEKLEFQITESGNNLSVGQRQLICLARAIIKHNRILIIDEATANVDHKTDNLIQETIRDKFRDCTVLTIAHRLNTIMDADRIMVLDAGSIVEFDEPYELLKRPKKFARIYSREQIKSLSMAGRITWRVKHRHELPRLADLEILLSKSFDERNKHDCLRKAQVPSIEKFIFAANIRKDDCFDRLHSDIDHLTSREILWHNSCYASYTSDRNLHSLSTGQTGSPQVNEVSEVSLKSQRNRPLTDWTKCIFCRNASRKRDFKLINIVTFEACNSIRTAAEARGDEELLPVLRTVELIASEGKYHKSCHASYVSKANIKSQCINGKPVNEYEDAFAEFLDIIRPEILNGKACNMNYLLQLYKDMLTKRDVNADSYTRQKLKLRLKLVFNDSLVFHQPHGSTKPEIVYSSSISLLDVINIAARTTENTTTSVAAQNEFLRDDPNESIKIIYKAAVIIRNDLSTCRGIKIDPLSLEDLYIQKARALIPDNLYWLVRYMVSSEVYAADQSPKASIVSHERKILMICQDVVHAASNARVKLPKHVSLEVTLRKDEEAPSTTTHCLRSRRVKSTTKVVKYTQKLSNTRPLTTKAVLKVVQGVFNKRRNLPEN